MTGPASATIDYNLYRDAAFTNVWGETIPTDTLSGTGNGATQPITVYGRVAPQTTPATGAYSDTVAVTVTY
jgi:spore coat protein U-like protein